MQKKDFPKKYFNKEILITSLFWDRAISSLTRPSAIEASKKLDKNYPCGINPEAKGVKFGERGEDSVIDTLMKVKLEHPEKLVLLRIGDFFEAIGVDALFLMEVGLRAMGGLGEGTPRAGVPLSGISTLGESLTQLGFSVVVMEQMDPPATSKSKAKERFIAQILSPSSPVYIYGMALDQKRDGAYPEIPPVYGVYEHGRGISLIEMYLDLNVSKITHGLTEEAVRAKLDRYGARIDTLYVHDNISESLRSYVERRKNINFSIEKKTIKTLKNELLHEFYHHIELDVKLNLNLPSSHKFIQVDESYSDDRPRPLYYATASQIGVLTQRGIPDLVNHMISKNAPEPCKNIVRDWLLMPPNAKIAGNLRSVINHLLTSKSEVQDFRTCNPARFIKTIQTKEASSIILKDLHSITEDFCDAMSGGLKGLNQEVLSVVSHISKLPCESEKILKDAEEIKLLLTNALPQNHEIDVASKGNEFFPFDFFENQEECFRGRLSRAFSVELFNCYEDAEASAKELIKAIEEDFVPIIYSNKSSKKKDQPQLSYEPLKAEAVWLKNLSKKDAEELGLIHPLDRKGKLVSDRWSSEKVETALFRYLESVRIAEKTVLSELRRISTQLAPKSISIINVSVFSNLMKTLILHVVSTRPAGWTLNVNHDKNNKIVKIEQYFPYWMNRRESTVNSIDLCDFALLTGPNMGGKSTTLRSIAVSSLLGICGFMVPASSVTLPLLDGIAVRTGAQDDPSSGISSFALEILDMVSILKESTKNSLVMIDELGKGTESRQGASIAAAILERLGPGCSEGGFDGIEVFGLFSTHWHELWSLPLRLDRFKSFHMDVANGKPTHNLKLGKALTSLAYETALRLNLPKEIVDRARRLENHFPVPENNETNNYHSKEESKEYHTLQSLEKVFLEETKADKDHLIYISEKGLPSPGEGGVSCVYLLRNDQGYFYVGETDNIFDRMSSHRKNKQKGRFSFVYVKIEQGKSAARKIESSLIARLLKEKVPLISSHDQEHQNFG